MAIPSRLVVGEIVIVWARWPFGFDQVENKQLVNSNTSIHLIPP